MSNTDALKAQVAANTALLQALAVHASANNREVYASIMNEAMQIASQLGGDFSEVSETAASLLHKEGAAQLERMTPKSALGPGGVQTKVMR